MNVTAQTDKLDVTPDSFWKRHIFENRVFEDNHYLYPFSQRELDRNKLVPSKKEWVIELLCSFAFSY